jgi:hypothetical protein
MENRRIDSGTHSSSSSLAQLPQPVNTANRKRPPPTDDSESRKKALIDESYVLLPIRCISLILKSNIDREDGVCSRCGNRYSSLKSHRALCARTSIACTYPSLSAPGSQEKQTLTRDEDGRFCCLCCPKRLKKDQHMKVKSFCFLSSVLICVQGAHQKLSRQ